MKINYKNADEKIIELEVSEEVGTFYLVSIDAEKKNGRKNSRPDRHSQLSHLTKEKYKMKSYYFMVPVPILNYFLDARDSF